MIFYNIIRKLDIDELADWLADTCMLVSSYELSNDEDTYTQLVEMFTKLLNKKVVITLE